MPVKTFFPNLSKTRIARGYSQIGMAELLEYRSVGRYAMYESGARKPNVIEALRIAEVLGESVEYLFVSSEKPSAGEGDLKKR